MLPDDPEKNLSCIWVDIEEIYQELDTCNKYGQMRMTMFTSKSAPKMKGKAAEIKDLGPVLVKVWKKYYNPGLTIHNKILTILEGSAHLDKILTDHPSDFVLPTADADDLISTGFIMLATWYEVFSAF